MSEGGSHDERKPLDVIIIGAGAGGGTLAYKLAPSGKRILLLERGDYVKREKDNWDPKAVNAEGKYQTKETGAIEMASRREMLDGLLMRFSWLRIHCASLPNQTDVCCGSSWEAKMKIPAYITGIELLVDGRFAQV